jgi:hypothetical protein
MKIFDFKCFLLILCTKISFVDMELSFWGLIVLCVEAISMFHRLFYGAVRIGDYTPLNGEMIDEC